MGDAVRIYSYSGARGSRRRRRGKRLLTILALLVLALLIWTFFVTRDSVPMAQLIPADQNYHLVAGDLMQKRVAFAESRLWELAPEKSAWTQLRERWRHNLGMPEWMLNNLMPEVAHVSGNDLDNFADMLFVTRMSRIGCLVEQLHHFIKRIDEDHAGGLRLRVLPAQDLYYAVRGRVLLLSPSRDALIRALTLHEQDALTQDALEERLAGLGPEDVRARVALEPSDPYGDYLSSVELVVQMRQEVARVLCRAQLRPDVQEAWAPVLRDVTPRTLYRPLPGLVELSGNLGKPLPAIWEELRPLLPEQALLPRWEVVRETLVSAAPALEARLDVLPQLLALSDDAWRGAWHGIDAAAMVPVPRLSGLFETDPALLLEMLTRLPEAAAAPPQSPRYDPASGVATLPVLEQVWEPGAALYGGQLLVTSQASLARELAAQPEETRVLREAGNIYLRVAPAPAFEALHEALAPFAQVGALRGLGAEEFEERMRGWRDTIGKVGEVAAHVSHEQGAVVLNLKVTMAGDGAVAARAGAGAGAAPAAG